MVLVVMLYVFSHLCTRVQSVQEDSKVSAPLCTAIHTGLVPPAAYRTDKHQSNMWLGKTSKNNKLKCLYQNSLIYKALISS